MVPWACVTPVDGSPNIVWGAEFILPCESWSLHQHALLWGAPNDPAEGFSSWWLPRWTGANWTCCVGLLSSLAIMCLSACSEGADPWAINSTCNEGAGRPWGRVPVYRVVAVRTNGSNGSVWKGAGVCAVHVVHGFPRNLGTTCSAMAGISTGIFILTPAYVGSAGLVTPSVRELVALLLAVCMH